MSKAQVLWKALLLNCLACQAAREYNMKLYFVIVMRYRSLHDRNGRVWDWNGSVAPKQYPNLIFFSVSSEFVRQLAYVSQSRATFKIIYIYQPQLEQPHEQQNTELQQQQMVHLKKTYLLMPLESPLNLSLLIPNSVHNLLWYPPSTHFLPPSSVNLSERLRILHSKLKWWLRLKVSPKWGKKTFVHEAPVS